MIKEKEEANKVKPVEPFKMLVSLSCSILNTFYSTRMTNLFFLFILDKQPHNFPTGIQLGKYLASHAEHRTKFWGNHGGGATINQLAKQRNAGVHRDAIPPKCFVGASRLSKQARQLNLDKDRDDIDPMSLPEGAPRQQKQARQLNLGKDRDAIDPMSFPSGASRQSKQARQENLGKDKDDIDPMSLPKGAPRQSKQARQENLGLCYLDRTSSEKKTMDAYKAAKGKVASLTREGFAIGVSNLAGDMTTSYTVEGAYRGLWNSIGEETRVDKKNTSIFTAFDRSIENRHEKGTKKWSSVSFIRICAGLINADGTLPSFDPYKAGGTLHVCHHCGKSYTERWNLDKHKKSKGH